MAGPTLNEPVIIVEDVASAVVEHARGASESCEVLEDIQGGWGVGRLQVPPESWVAAE